MTGVIVLDKPQSFTSFDAVAVLRKIAGERKIGHTGTLDPMATGVLPMLLGRGTKALPLLPDTEKSYQAEFRLGLKTDTGDIWGRVVKTQDFLPEKASLQAVLPQFCGEIWQLPPMYSAVSVGGERLYKLARQGIEVAREKRPVVVSALQLLSFDPSTGVGTLSLTCSKGTYVRTLIEDLAEAVGALGTMTALRRTLACAFSLEESVTLDTLRAEGAAGFLRPIETLFAAYPKVRVSEAQETRFLNGGNLDAGRVKLPTLSLVEGQSVRLWGSAFLGLATFSQGELKFLKQFLAES